MDADEIIVLNEGKVIETGSHDELLEKREITLIFGNNNSQY